MSTFDVVSIVAAAMVGVSAVALFTGAAWATDSLTSYGVPRSWWPWLGTAKAAGAAGLLAGLAEQAIGVAAAIGLVAYFTGAVVTVIRARYYSHIPFPLVYVAPVVATLAVAAAG